MIVPENMLCFIFSRKKLLIGMNPPESSPRLLTFDDKHFLPYEGRAIPDVIHMHWDNILNAYRQGLDKPMEQIPISMVIKLPLISLCTPLNRTFRLFEKI